MRVPLLLACVLGCSKPSAGEGAEPVKPAPVESAPLAPATEMLVPSMLPAPPEKSAAPSSAPPPTAVHAPAPSAVLPAGEGMRASGATWEVEVPAPRPCDRAAACDVTVVLKALGAFHINKDYPTKLTLDEAPGLEPLGTDAKGKNVFSVAAGNFVLAAEKTGTMTARFKSASAGLQKLGGTLKFSVCSAANCQMETAKITAGVPVR